MSTDAATAAAAEPVPVSVAPFREWLLSTLPATATAALSAERRAALLDAAVTPLPELYDACLALQGSESAVATAPNALRWDVPADVMESLGANIIAANKATLDKVRVSWDQCKRSSTVPHWELQSFRIWCPGLMYKRV